MCGEVATVHHPPSRYNFGGGIVIRYLKNQPHTGLPRTRRRPVMQGHHQPWIASAARAERSKRTPRAGPAPHHLATRKPPPYGQWLLASRAGTWEQGTGAVPSAVTLSRVRRGRGRPCEAGTRLPRTERGPERLADPEAEARVPPPKIPHSQPDDADACSCEVSSTAWPARGNALREGRRAP